ncbi:BTB/POZ domain-containing protein 3 [Trichoderma asperellum]|uniref:BTB/POZ domain-containing protein 3 n=1 Tax=Trichoderma asperellum TaxID=101201 RepID=A0A6V8QY71_TRIAP|nr:BTB/POZ domain-containing protein 3 [Trichoderma asperellum]
MVLGKHELEGKLGEESLLIKSGVLRDENPLDTSAQFHEFLLACRQGDLQKCQQLISMGVNINGKDKFDYTPLILASLCGHYELVQVLLEAGALAERNTFQGERCIYNALNDRIRNLLLQYDFSKSSDPYVYWSSHISTLLGRPAPQTADISLDAGNTSFNLHKFLLASRTPYFRRKLEAAPETETFKLSSSIPVEAFQIAVRYIYLGDLPKDLAPPGSATTEEEVAKGLDKISKLLEIEQLWEAILVGNDRRLARQRYEDEVERARNQIGDFFQQSIVGHKMVVDIDRVDEVRWKYDNSIFADILLRADEPDTTDDAVDGPKDSTSNGYNSAGIPIGPSQATNGVKKARKSVLYPAHKAMLIRSEYFDKMFSGDFVESQKSDHLHVVTVDCTPAVLELILSFLYTETATCPLEHALDLLYAADMLFLDSLKNKAAIAISTLGSGSNNALVDRTHSAGEQTGDVVEVEPINIYDVIHAAWDLRVQRLEEFAARYLAHRLEYYIDEPDFHELIRESAERIQKREETDTIELLDDIRYYLSERFRLRFEDAGLEEMMDEEGEINAQMAAALADGALDAQPETKTTENGLTTDAANGDTTPLPEAKKGEDDDSQPEGDAMRTLDGETAEDEFASDAINYQILLQKIDAMLEGLKLDA